MIVSPDWRCSKWLINYQLRIICIFLTSEKLPKFLFVFKVSHIRSLPLTPKWLINMLCESYIHWIIYKLKSQVAHDDHFTRLALFSILFQVAYQLSYVTHPNPISISETRTMSRLTLILISVLQIIIQTQIQIQISVQNEHKYKYKVKYISQLYCYQHNTDNDTLESFEILNYFTSCKF